LRLVGQLHQCARQHVQAIDLGWCVGHACEQHERPVIGPAHGPNERLAVRIVLPGVHAEHDLWRRWLTRLQPLRIQVQQQDPEAVEIALYVGLARDDEGMRLVRRHLRPQRVGIALARLDDARELDNRRDRRTCRVVGGSNRARACHGHGPAQGDPGRPKQRHAHEFSATPAVAADMAPGRKPGERMQVRKLSERPRYQSTDSRTLA
jgi:hypothetical protein